MQVIPTQTRDFNYQQVQHKIPKQNDLVMDALYTMREADAEKIQSWIFNKIGKMFPLTSIRRSLTNLTNIYVKPGNKRVPTNNGGTATVYELNDAGLKKMMELPF